MCGDIGSVAAKCCMKRLMHNGSGNMFARHARRQQGCLHTHTGIYNIHPYSWHNPSSFIDIPRVLIGSKPIEEFLLTPENLLCKLCERGCK